MLNGEWMIELWVIQSLGQYYMIKVNADAVCVGCCRQQQQQQQLKQQWDDDEEEGSLF